MAIMEEHIQDFTDVIHILEIIDGELNSETHVCKGCNREGWDDLQEGRLGQEVKALLRKSRKCLLVVKGKTTRSSR
jgi:hypothetical protein